MSRLGGKCDDVKHSRTSSTTSSNSDEGLVLSVANLKAKSTTINNNVHGDECDSSAAKNPALNGDLDDVKSLRAELEKTRFELKAKDEEVARLARIREELEEEIQDLTASLFQEAHRMVGEANVKAAASERSLEEASMKIDGLETEVAALRTLMLTSTPSKPNRHLHPQISTKKKSSRSASQLANLSNGSIATPADAHASEERHVDPVLRKEYLSWKQEPRMALDSDFVKRLYCEDVDPCLRFPNSELAARIRAAVEANDLSMVPIVLPRSGDLDSATTNHSLPKVCALLEAPLVCHFQVHVGENVYEISQLARNRIAATCECLNYLRYICQGLVKAHHNDVYWEIVLRRKKMMLARLGFSPGDI